MSCVAMSDRLLEADRAELEGRGASPVAAHIRTCAACRATAARILRGEEEIRAALSVIARDQPPANVVGVWTKVPKQRRVASWVRFAAAAAVVILGVLWLRPGGPQHGNPPGPITVSARSVRGPEVLRASGDYALMQTDNPRITVVWILDRDPSGLQPVQR